MPPRKRGHEDAVELSLEEKKTSVRFLTLISPRELHEQQDDIGFITVEH